MPPRRPPFPAAAAHDRRLWPSALAAAIFAVHPLRVESVAWVAERKDVLSGLFFMLTVWAYVAYAGRPFSWLRYALVVLVYALGLMAKPMLVTLPLVLLLLDYWPLGRFTAAEKGPPGDNPAPKFWRLGRLLLEKLPLLALAAASCVVTVLAQCEAIIETAKLPLDARAANAVVSLAAYLGKFFFPARLAVFYQYPPSFSGWEVAGALAILVLVTAGVILTRRKCPYLLVGWLWYLGMMVPVIGLVQVGVQAMADRYTYLPMIGVTIALVWLLASLAGAWAGAAWSWASPALAVAARSGLRLATDHLFARQRGAVEPRPGLRPAHSPGSKQPGHVVDGAGRIGAGHPPLPGGLGHRPQLCQGAEQPQLRPVRARRY